MANYSGFCRMCIGLYELQVREELERYPELKRELGMFLSDRR